MTCTRIMYAANILKFQKNKTIFKKKYASVNETVYSHQELQRDSGALSIGQERHRSLVQQHHLTAEA